MSGIVRGTKVIVTDRRGFKWYGYVHTAVNWGTEKEPDWYVEWYEQRWSGYHYTKQQQDGANVQFAEGSGW